MVLSRRLEDEMAITEQTSEEGLLDRDVENTSHGHRRQVLIEDAMDAENPHVGDDETVHVIQVKAQCSPGRQGDSHHEGEAPPPLRKDH